MFNPWVILGIVLAIGGAFGGGFLYGGHVATAEAAQDREQAIAGAIAAHEEQAAEDMATAYEVGLAKGRARTAAATNRESFNVALSAAPRRPATCDMPAAAFISLQHAVELANANEVPSIGLPRAVSKPAASLKPPSR